MNFSVNTLPQDVSSRIIPVTESGCWIWDGPDDFDKGYGRYYKNYKQYKAHRVVYELLVGPIPPGLVIDHLCRVTCCVNPSHLRVCTSRDNTLAGVSRPAINIKKTHCKRGHLLSGDNLFISWEGTRQCRACYRIHDKRRKDRMRARQE